MWISRIELRNIKSFGNPSAISLSKGINTLIGLNNAGKSVLIKALLMLQDTSDLGFLGIRAGQSNGEITLGLEDVTEGDVLSPIGIVVPAIPNVAANILIKRTNPNAVTFEYSIYDGRGGKLTIRQLSNQEPTNFIYPFLSKRKATSFREAVNRKNAEEVTTNLVNLISKVDRISRPQDPYYEEYKKRCQDILGFGVYTFLSGSGKQAGIPIDHYDGIPLEAMGEGVTNLLGIIVDLCVAQHKLFLIEELENDIQPKVLKKLLEFIIEKSEVNQFVISTHSNIVARYLGAVPESKVFYVTMELENRIPTSSCREVSEPDERRKILEELGYELLDYNLAEGWMFFEESSAERIIREFLIPWFIPGLVGKVRTIAAGGTSDVEPKFADFNRLFLFLHLESMYKNYAWVIVDGEPSGRDIIQKLKDRYVPSGWSEDNFINFSKHNFEEYYPDRFDAARTTALAIHSKRDKMEAKKQLLKDVVDWITMNEQEAKEEFEKSAGEVITILRKIEAKN
jgi:hypothetical protein